MTNEELKAIIADMVCDDDELNSIIVLEGDEFADGCIGISTDNHLTYGYEKLVESLMDAYMKNDNVTEDEARTMAIDWLEYNTIRSLPYMKSAGHEPIIIRELEF